MKRSPNQPDFFASMGTMALKPGARAVNQQVAETNPTAEGGFPTHFKTKTSIRLDHKYLSEFGKFQLAIEQFDTLDIEPGRIALRTDGKMHEKFEYFAIPTYAVDYITPPKQFSKGRFAVTQYKETPTEFEMHVTQKQPDGRKFFGALDITRKFEKTHLQEGNQSKEGFELEIEAKISVAAFTLTKKFVGWYANFKMDRFAVAIVRGVLNREIENLVNRGRGLDPDKFFPKKTDPNDAKRIVPYVKESAEPQNGWFSRRLNFVIPESARNTVNAKKLFAILLNMKNYSDVFARSTECKDPTQPDPKGHFKLMLDGYPVRKEDENYLGSIAMDVDFSEAAKGKITMTSSQGAKALRHVDGLKMTYSIQNDNELQLDVMYHSTETMNDIIQLVTDTAIAPSIMQGSMMDLTVLAAKEVLQAANMTSTSTIPSSVTSTTSTTSQPVSALVSGSASFQLPKPNQGSAKKEMEEVVNKTKGMSMSTTTS